MTPPPIASFGAALRHVFLRDMVLPASIGIYPHEHAASQRIRINVDLAVDDDAAIAGVIVGPDELARVVDYEKIARRVRGIVGAAETLAERSADACLQDPRVKSARIRVEKLDIFADSVSAGVEVERCRRHSST